MTKQVGPPPSIGLQGVVRPAELHFTVPTPRHPSSTTICTRCTRSHRANAAEMAMGMLMEATVPTSHRWIPKAMNVQYLQKATTSLRATARIDPPDFTSITDGTELVVPVS